uniref:SDR family NAD(P)-dependent oxidoreductase n=1 Tax=Phenylobacterium glaciei TaxID=2803784 RepID=A0A974S9T9_9CAUL|nr:SDR family NAD(P)-dependent oxidoreductase [Phenylobacterium glaciei]
MPKTVLITGCSTGFGQAAAHLFAARGWNVVATMRNAVQSSALAALPNVLVTRLDVQDRASIETAIAEGSPVRPDRCPGQQCRLWPVRRL